MVRNISVNGIGEGDVLECPVPSALGVSHEPETSEKGVDRPNPEEPVDHKPGVGSPEFPD